MESIGKCAKCGFELNSEWGNGMYWSDHVLINGVNGAVCSEEMGEILQDIPKEFYERIRYNHVLETKENVVRKLLNQIDSI